eukprot:606365-Amphidinium_carterae.1
MQGVENYYERVKNSLTKQGIDFVNGVHTRWLFHGSTAVDSCCERERARLLSFLTPFCFLQGPTERRGTASERVLIREMWTTVLWRTSLKKTVDDVCRGQHCFRRHLRSSSSAAERQMQCHLELAASCFASCRCVCVM